MYATKNSITLAIFLVTFWLIGFFLIRKDSEKLGQLKRESKKIESQYEKSQAIIKNLGILETEHQFLKSNWDNAPKVLISADEPAFSYLFLNKIISEKHLNFDINFILSKKIIQTSYSSFSYILEGEGTYTDVYKLIWFINSTSILYQIKSIEFQNIEPNSDLIEFSIKLESYSMEEKWDVGNKDKEYEISNSPLTVNYKTFKPIIIKPKVVKGRRTVRRQTIIKPVNLNLPDLDKSSLEAAMAGKILIRDQKGELKTLSLGDKVKDGYLSKIDLQKSEAFFLMKDQKVYILGLGYSRKAGKISSRDQDAMLLQ